MKYLIWLAFSLIAGCTSSDPVGETRREFVADFVNKQKGRYQLVAGSENFPPLVLDTATGCIRSVSVVLGGQVKFSSITLGGDPEADLDECNQHLFLRTTVVGKPK